MHEDFVVLLVPVIDAIPVERDEIPDRRDLVVRIGIGPDGILGCPVANPDRPVRSVSLVRAERPVRGRRQKRHANVGPGEIIDRQMARLEQQMRAGAVGDRRAVEGDAHPARRRFEQNPVVGVVLEAGFASVNQLGHSARLSRLPVNHLRKDFVTGRHAANGGAACEASRRHPS